MFKKIIDFIKEIIKKIRFEMKCREADDMWWLMFGNCFELFPPSFYMKHTPEEVKRITEEICDELDALIDSYMQEDNESA